MQQKARAVAQAKDPASIKDLTQAQTAWLIVETQNRINDNMKKMSELEPSLNEYKEAYLSLQKQHDEMRDKVSADEIMLEVYTKFTHNIPANRKMRVIRAESHNDMKPKEQKKLQEGDKRPKIFLWTNYAVEFLTIERKFFKPDDLFTRMIKKYKVEEVYREMGKELRISHIKWGVINNCWLANAEKTKRGNNKGKLVYIDGRLGLKDWANEAMKIRPEFLAEKH